jgi:asparagine synthase (glutamine-hydrolysing)
MCGIFVHLPGSGNVLDYDLAHRCLSRLAHRGPDGEGLWQESGVTLGHRRLAILDTSSAGHQPMLSADGRYVATYNGEIYNFLEIRQELEALGHSFRSQSDTEVLLTAFRQWGKDCLDRFNGMWALAIWDTRERKLFLARDRFGKKPLFYARLAGGGLAFASEMKALFPLLSTLRPNIDLIRDPDRLMTYEATAACLVDGIERFPAGHRGWVNLAGTLHIERWWHTLDHLPAPASNFKNSVEQLEELLLDACRLRMRSDVPLGTALSGGLDSGTVAACMAAAETIKGSHRAFVMSFPGSALDETAGAQKVARHLGLPLAVLEVDTSRLAADLERQLWLFEEIYLTSPAPFMDVYRQIKNAGVSVTLDGHGADELFGGYHFDFLAALRDASPRPHQAWQVVNAFFDQLALLTPQPFFRRLKFWAGAELRGIARSLLPTRNIISSCDQDHPRWRQLDHLTRKLYVSTHETILPTLLRNYDRCSMAHGVEIRMPFLDHRIATLAFALPWHHKFRNGRSKAVLRSIAEKRLPQEIAGQGTKIGFNPPLADWLRGPLRPYLEDLLNSRAFRESEVHDPKRTRSSTRRVLDAPNSDFCLAEQAWRHLAPHLWERAVVINPLNVTTAPCV